jgi:hypothetical protein
MKNITFTRKQKAIIGLSVGALIFSAGAYARPAIDIGILLGSTLFDKPQATYVAPPSEYETKVAELWKSERHQAVCKATAASMVSVELARKYLDEYEKQNALAQWETPLSEVKMK